MSRTGLLRGALCAVVLVASLASAQQYADAATLQALRNNIELVRQQVNQLRGMGADAATMSLMQENLRYLELQYSSLAGTGPAPGSPQMVAAERAWLETQYRNLQTQRQQLAQMGADRASLQMLDQSLAEMRRSIDSLNATALNAPAYNAPGYNPGGLPGQSNLSPTDSWVATYNPVGPNGQDCTPYYDGNLNRMLVPVGCPMPTGGAPLPPLPGATTLPKYDLKPLPAGIPGSAQPGTRSAPPAPNAPRSYPNTVTTPTPTFQSAPGFTPMPGPTAPRPSITSAPMDGAEVSMIPQCGFEVLPPCRSKDGTIKGDASAYYAPAPATATGGGSTTVNWGQKDKRPPSINTTRSTTSKFEQTTTISRYDIAIDGCKVKEARVDYKHNGFLGDAQVTGKVTLAPAGCTPNPNTRLFLRLEQGGVVGWIEMKPNWSSNSASGFSSLTSTDQAVHKLEGFAVVGTWDKATAIKFFTDGVVKGFLVVPGK